MKFSGLLLFTITIMHLFIPLRFLPARFLLGHCQTVCLYYKHFGGVVVLQCRMATWPSTRPAPKSVHYKNMYSLKLKCLN